MRQVGLNYVRGYFLWSDRYFRVHVGGLGHKWSFTRRIMPQCCVPHCNNRSENCDLSFYRFPTAESEKKKWLRTIKRQNFIPTTNSRVCSWHFPMGKEAGPRRFAWNTSLFTDGPSPEKRRRKGTQNRNPNQNLNTNSALSRRLFELDRRKWPGEEWLLNQCNPLVVLAYVALYDAIYDDAFWAYKMSMGFCNYDGQLLDSSKQEVKI